MPSVWRSRRWCPLAIAASTAMATVTAWPAPGSWPPTCRGADGAGSCATARRTDSSHLEPIAAGSALTPGWRLLHMSVRTLIAVVAAAVALSPLAAAEMDVSYPAKPGPGEGRHVVLL